MLKSVQKYISEIPKRFYFFKIKYSEIRAIIEKRKIYKDVEWNNKQIEEFNRFWIENYGKTIKPWWNMLYEATNGVYRKDYFPEILFTTKLEPILNPKKFCSLIENKSMTEFLYGCTVKIPEVFGLCCNGNYLSSEKELLTFEMFVECCSNIGECVIKPTVETGSGKGVCILNLKNGIDIKTDEAVADIVLRYGKNFVIQKKIVNSKEFSDIYPYSVNTIRLITYIVGAEVHNATPVMRIGTGGTTVDNIHMGGLCIGVNENGRLKERAYQLGYGNKTVVLKKHPDTGITFKDYYIGNIEKMIDKAKELHSNVPYVDVISWDLTIDDNNEIVLIEANCSGQGIWFPQIVNEESLFKDDTAYMIKKMRDKK